VVLAPGSLYRSVLATAAVPDLVAALRSTRARVLWIPNLAADSREAANMIAIDHLLALRLHGIRVDAVMHDPAATLGFDADELTSYGVEPLPRELRHSTNPAMHDPEQLRLALRGLIGSRPIGTVGGRDRDRGSAAAAYRSAAG
jgi:2-phospho-L-lactate transferase CofD